MYNSIIQRTPKEIKVSGKGEGILPPWAEVLAVQLAARISILKFVGIPSTVTSG
jgi:hypothetical protein